MSSNNVSHDQNLDNGSITGDPCVDKEKSSQQHCHQTPVVTVKILKQGILLRKPKPSQKTSQSTLPTIPKKAGSLRRTVSKVPSTPISAHLTPLRRKCRDFSGPPKPQPLTVVFHAPHNSLDHKTVLCMVKRRLSYLPTQQQGVLAIRCEVRNVILGSSGLPDRWHVRVCCEHAVKELLRGLHTGQQSFVVRVLDTVVQEEYRTFLRLQTMTAQIMALAI